MPEKSIRPTILLTDIELERSGQLIAISGYKDRSNIMYDIATDQWVWLPKLPIGHHNACSICVNYYDKAIFAFFVDGKFNLKCAVLPLHNLKTSVCKDEDLGEMQVVLDMP
jgi:hypothetical protein